MYSADSVFVKQSVKQGNQLGKPNDEVPKITGQAQIAEEILDTGGARDLTNTGQQLWVGPDTLARHEVA